MVTKEESIYFNQGLLSLTTFFCGKVRLRKGGGAKISDLLTTSTVSSSIEFFWGGYCHPVASEMIDEGRGCSEYLEYLGYLRLNTNKLTYLGHEPFFAPGSH